MNIILFLGYFLILAFNTSAYAQMDTFDFGKIKFHCFSDKNTFDRFHTSKNAQAFDYSHSSDRHEQFLVAELPNPSGDQYYHVIGSRRAIVPINDGREGLDFSVLKVNDDLNTCLLSSYTISEDGIVHQVSEVIIRPEMNAASMYFRQHEAALTKDKLYVIDGHQVLTFDRKTGNQLGSYKNKEAESLIHFKGENGEERVFVICEFALMVIDETTHLPDFVHRFYDEKLKHGGYFSSHASANYFITTPESPYGMNTVPTDGFTRVVKIHSLATNKRHQFKLTLTDHHYSDYVIKAVDSGDKVALLFLSKQTLYELQNDLTIKATGLGGGMVVVFDLKGKQTSVTKLTDGTYPYDLRVADGQFNVIDYKGNLINRD